MLKAVIALAAVFGGACQCESGPAKKVAPGICAKETKCDKGQSYRKGTCVTDRCDSKKNGDADCCPGQFCTVDGRCVNKHEQAVCSTDLDCGAREAGRICMARPELNANQNVCSFPIPTESGQCPVTYRLFNKRCIRELPCNGGCGDNQLCNIETNECEAIPSIPTSNSGCEVTCQTGTIKTLADPDGMIFNQCCALACLCEALPPLFEGAYGAYADGAVTSNNIYASSYDVTYGDLVVSTHDKIAGKVTKLEFVDGFPTAGKLGGDPNGPRQGRSEPGPDVGRYTTLVVGTDGQPRVAYYDVDNKDLKYAERTSDGKWAIHTVDSQGAVGKYADMELTAGKLRIAYFAEAAPGMMGDVTTLRYAEAKTLSPRSASDWTIVDAVIAQPVRKPCAGACATGELCLYVDSMAPAQFLCGKKDTGCMGTKPAGKECTLPNGQAKGYYAIDPIPQTDELPNGVGLFPSMIQKDDKLLIAYMDNYTGPSTAPPFTFNNATLRGVVATLTAGAAGTFSTPAILDNGTMCQDAQKHSVGSFTSMTQAPDGRIGIAYSDTTANQLRLYWPPMGELFTNAPSDCFPPNSFVHTNNRVYIVDTGVDTGSTGLTFVGADASLYFDAVSKPFIAYHDQTHLDVRVAGRKSDGTWQVDYLSQEKGDGFETQLLTEGNVTWLLSVQIGRDNLQNPTDKLVIRPVILPSVP